MEFEWGVLERCQDKLPGLNPWLCLSQHHTPSWKEGFQPKRGRVKMTPAQQLKRRRLESKQVTCT